MAALQNPTLGLLTPEQQDLFSRLHRHLSADQRRRATREDGPEDVDTGKAGRRTAVSSMRVDVFHRACCRHSSSTCAASFSRINVRVMATDASIFQPYLIASPSQACISSGFG